VIQSVNAGQRGQDKVAVQEEEIKELKTKLAQKEQK